MATDRTIEYKLTVDTETGKQTVTDLNGKIVDLDKNIKTTQKTTIDYAQNIRDLSLAFNGAIESLSRVGRGLMSFINEAEQSRSEINQLNIAFKNAGEIGNKASQEFLKFANSMESAGIASGGAITKTAALGVQMGISIENIQGATQSAYGLAKAYGIDADTAIKIVSQSIQGNYAGLQKLNPAIAQAGNEAQVTAAANKMLSNSYEFAQSEANTFSGTMVKVTEQVNGLKDEIGQVIIEFAQFGKYLDLSASFELFKMGLAQIVNALVFAKDFFIEPFVLMGKTAANVIVGIKNALNELLTADLIGANTALANMFQKIYTDSAQSITKQQEAIKTGFTQAIDIYDQAQKNIESKQEERANLELQKLKAQKQALNEAEIKAAEERLQIAIDGQLSINQALAELKEQEIAETIAEPKEAGLEYTAEQQLADQQIADELLLEQERTFSAQVLDIETGTHQARLQALQDQLISYEMYQNLELAAKKKTESEKLKTQSEANKQGVKNVLADLQALKTLGSDAAKVAKAAAIADTTISTIEGAQKSYTWGATWGGPVAGAIMAAISYAAGIARVAQITSTSTGFQSGGYTGNVPVDQVAGVIHGQEFVMNAEATKAIGVSNLMAMQSNAVNAPMLPGASFAGSMATSGFNGVSGSIKAMNSNIVNNTAGGSQPVVNINASIDWIKFEEQRRYAENDVNNSGYKADNL